MLMCMYMLYTPNVFIVRICAMFWGAAQQLFKSARGLIAWVTAPSQ